MYMWYVSLCKKIKVVCTCTEKYCKVYMQYTVYINLDKSKTEIRELQRSIETYAMQYFLQ